MRNESRRPQGSRDLLRLLTSEYEALKELARGPIDLSQATRTLAGDVRFLLLWKLAEREGQTASISSRGRMLLEREPVSRAEHTLAFDVSEFGW